MITIIDAILEIDAKAQVSVVGENIDTAVLTWSSSEISRADIKTKMAELQTQYDNNQYQRDREAEYPTIQELVVALYDTDDKSAIEAKRAEVKKKYPKP